MAVEITEEFVWQNIPRRARDSHKGTFGSVLAVAGSAFYRGAALLAAEGALRTGAGIVTLASVEPVVSAAVTRLPECCLCPCKEGAQGGIAPEMCRCSGGRRLPFCCWDPALAAQRKALPGPPRPARWCSSFCPALRGLRCWTQMV